MTKQWAAQFSGNDIELAEELRILLEEKRGITLSRASSVKQAVRLMVQQLRAESSVTRAA